MAFEKAKVLKAAEKFLSQGKINAAIKEYRQIIENDDKDLTALNMLGDLLARAGEGEEAIVCFTRIAEHYREQEFRLKAIAMYRKIEKLKPRDPATAHELAELYAAQGLVVDARAQYLIVADACTRAGESKKTLHVLHKIADLDPHNTEIRIKLAKGYLNENMAAEAVRAFSEAANRMLENGEFEKSRDVYSKVLELRPQDDLALRGLVKAHVGLGMADDAAELLEKAIAERPDEPELVSMLAQAYIDAEDAAGAEKATALLMSRDASNYRLYIEVGRVYLKLNQEAEAARILGIIIEPMLAGREENDLLELVNELLARNPEHVASLRLLARIHWWQRDMDKLRSALERLSEAAEAGGLVDDERYALTQLVRLVPDEPRYLERLDSIGGFLEEPSHGASMAEDAAFSAVPSFGNFDIVTQADPDVAEGQVAEGEPQSEFEYNSVADQDFSDSSASFADLNESDADSGGEPGVKLLPDPQSPKFSVQEFTIGVESEGQAPTEQSEPGEGIAKTPESMMAQELESVDFYITQGYSDIAADTLDLLEKQFGSHPEIEARREKLRAEREGPAADSAVDVSLAEAGQPVPAAPVQSAPVPEGSGIDSGLAEIFEEFRLDAEGEHSTSNEDYETHFNMATAYKEMDLLDEAIREFQIAAGLTGPVEGSARYFQCCNMLGHCFLEKGLPRAAVLWFKKGIESPGRTSEEYMALQYELGSAYDQMGDLTRAVEVFTEVYGVDVSYRDIVEKLQDLQARRGSQKKKKGK